MAYTKSGLDLPLANVHVLDLCTGPGSSAARFLADLGADVILVDVGEFGSRSRGLSADLRRAAHHANKRSIALDLSEGSDDLETLWKLAARSDIIFEDAAPAAADSSVTARALRARLPHAVTVSVTDFGLSGPYRDWVGSDAVYVALSGELSRSGLPGREPILPPGRIATESAAAQAAWAALVAYFQRVDTGRGQLVDFSLLEAVSQTLDPGWGIGGSATGGKPAAAGPRGRPDSRHMYPIFKCADGHVRLCILAPRQWQAMFKWLGEPEELADPGLANLPNRFAAQDIIYPAIERLFADRTRAQIVEEGRDFGVPSAALLAPSEVFEVEQFGDRGAFAEVPVGEQTALLSNGMVEIDGHRAGIRSLAPTRDAHRADILAELSARQPTSHELVSGTTDPNERLPLTGLRVLDLGVIVAGAEVSRLFADLGAEVIKVENSRFPDGVRQSLNGEPMSYSVAWGLRNKKSLGLNLRTPDGLAVFKELVAQADVVLSNFKPGTMDSLGLSYEALSAVNPGIVVADSSAYGPSGPWSSRMGYGPLVRSEAGLSGLWRYPDDPDGFSDATTVYPDHTSGRVEAAAVLAVLLRRRLTGRGGRVSVAQAEVILGQTAVEFALESVQPGSLRAVGNQLPGDAPRGVYPCLGDDEWVVIDIQDDDDFNRLARVIGRPEWVADERFASADARVEHRKSLDLELAAWTAGWTPKQAASLMQAGGVPAGMMLRVVDLLDDPHLAERRFFRTMQHPLLPTDVPAENHPAVFESVADAPLHPAPLAGEHSRDVLHRVLSYDAGRVDSLVAAGVVEEAAQKAHHQPSPAL